MMLIKVLTITNIIVFRFGKILIVECLTCNIIIGVSTIQLYPHVQTYVCPSHSKSTSAYTVP